MKYSVLIVEDDEIACAVIQKNLSFYPNFQLAVAVSTIKDAIVFLSNNVIDVIFLDIQLPDGEGFDILQHVNGKPAVVIITSDASYAFSAFEYGVLDFLKKTIVANRFGACISKIETYLKNKPKLLNSASADVPFIFVKAGLKYVRINIHEIIYIESINEYANVFLKNNKTILVNYSLKEILTKLNGHGLVQVHRSYALNLQYVNYVVEGIMILDNAKEIPLGKTYRNEILKLLK